MKLIVFISLFVLAATALPIAIDINGSHQLQKRDGTNDLIVTIVKALVVFGGFIWGGGIIAKRGVNYYFDKLDERQKQNLLAVGKVHALIEAKKMEEQEYV
jgi:F0F1-type ATP synthase membrane subunit a